MHECTFHCNSFDMQCVAMFLALSTDAPVLRIFAVRDKYFFEHYISTVSGVKLLKWNFELGHDAKS